MISEDDLSASADDASADEELPEWRRSSVQLARAMQEDESGRFAGLPGSFDIDEWDLMRRFAQREAGPDAGAALLEAIQGRGAFRRFRDRLHSLGLTDQWYAYRGEQYRRIAIDWCERHGIALEADGGVVAGHE